MNDFSSIPLLEHRPYDLILDMDDQDTLTHAVIRGRRKEVPDLVKQCLDAGEDARSIVENRPVPGMMVVGERFKRNEIFVPEMLVAMMWKGSGIEVIDLGVNVPPAKFVAAIAQHKPDLVGLSTLLTTVMPAMRTTHTIRDAGLPVKILVGGAPITHEFATEIGADGYAQMPVRRWMPRWHCCAATHEHRRWIAR